MSCCSLQAYLLIWSPQSSDKIAGKVGSFHFLSMCGEGKGVCIDIFIVSHGMLGERTQRTAPIKTPWDFSLANTFADLDAMEQRQDSQ